MHNIKKYLIIVSFLAVLVAPSFASAVTVEELQVQINNLLAQVQQLQAQLAQMQGQPATWCYDFNRDLKYGNGGTDVYNLQIALEKEGFSIAQDEKNQKNFGESTADAVSGFQQKYKDEILTPLGLKYGTGYVGEKTRAKLNLLYGCGVTPTPVCIQVITPAQNPQTGECKNFPTPCDVPSGWVKVSSCPTTATTYPIPAGYSSWEEYNKDISVNKPAKEQGLPQSVADRAWQIVKNDSSIPASSALPMAAKEAGYAPSPYTPTLKYVYIPLGDPPIPQPAVVTITQSDLSRCAPITPTTPPPTGYSSWFAYNIDISIIKPAVNFRLPPSVALKAANILIQSCTGTATIILQQVAKESGYVVSPYSSPIAPFYVYVSPVSLGEKGKLYGSAVIKLNNQTGVSSYCAGPKPSDGTAYQGALNDPIYCGTDNIPKCKSGFRRVMMGTVDISSTEQEKYFTCESMEGQTPSSYTKGKLYGAAVIKDSTTQGIYYCAGPKPSDGTSYAGALNDPIYCGSDNIPKCKSGFRRVMTGTLQVSSAEMEKTFTCESMEGQATISYAKGELYGAAVIKENPAIGSIFYCAGPMPSDGTSYAGALNSPISCGSDNIPRCVSGFRRVMMGTLPVSSTELQKMFTCENMTGYVISSSLNPNQMANILESAREILNKMLDFLKRIF